MILESQCEHHLLLALAVSRQAHLDCELDNIVGLQTFANLSWLHEGVGVALVGEGESFDRPLLRTLVLDAPGKHNQLSRLSLDVAISGANDNCDFVNGYSRTCN